MALTIVFTRALGVVFFLPLGKGLSDMFVRVGFALTIAFSFQHIVHSDVSTSMYAYMYEFLVGVFLSLPFVFVIEVGAIVGDVIDTGRGMSIAQFYDASFEGQQGVLPRLFRHVFWIALLCAGGLRLLCETLANSYHFLPAIAVTSGYKGIGDLLVMVPVVLSFMTQALTHALVLSLPFALLFLCLDLLLGFIGKILPQIHLLQESFLVKTLVSFMALYLLIEYGFGSSLQQFLKHYPTWVGMNG